MARLFNEAAKADRSLVPASSCGELASIYCAPDAKYHGIGRRLMAVFARAMLDLGYRGMITRAYVKNDSPAFFERLGAKFMGACPIPNDYLTPEGNVATLEIPGVWLYWTPDALRKIAAEAVLA